MRCVFCCVDSHPQRTVQLVSMRLLVRCFRCLCLVILAPAQPAGKPRCPGALGPAGRGRRASGTACHEEGCLGMLPLLDVQRPWAGTESGGTPDSAQFIICGTVIPPPPSSREVPVQVAGWAGLHAEGRSALQAPRPVCACAGPYLGVASAPRGSSWGGRWSRGLLDVSARGSGFPVLSGSREGLCCRERYPVLHLPGQGTGWGVVQGGGAACSQ